MAERQQQRLPTAVGGGGGAVGGLRRTTRRTVETHTTFQNEIDNWIAVAKKSSTTANKLQEEEAQTMLTSNGLTKLRELQKEICQTNWMFDNNYP